MQRHVVSDGVVIHHASHLTVVAGTQIPISQLGDVRKRRARGPNKSEPLHEDLTHLLRELKVQDFQLVTNFTVTPRPRRPGMRARRASTLPGGLDPIIVDVVLADDEDAVVLTVDSFGGLDWVYADGTRVSTADLHGPRRTRTRAARARPATNTSAQTSDRTVQFTIAALQTSPGRAAQDGRRSRAMNVVRAVGGWLFKFIRRKVTGQLIKHLEKGVSTGLVRIDSTVPSQWTVLGERFSLPRSAAATNAAPRVLLLIHGTFSSTVGSFGGLAFTLPGIALLHSMDERYDHILGWDHRTLSETPEQNARAIRDALDRAFPDVGHPPKIDVLAFSRGGLVTRILLENIVTGTRWEHAFARVVFVACTLGGTLLAQRTQWTTLVTVMTNLAIAACRGVTTAMPAAAVAAVWVETVARGVAALVRFLATALLDPEAVPGLAAMDPQLRVVQDLDRSRPSDKTLKMYHAVSNDYEPNGAGADESSEAMPSALKLKLWDLVMDAQMRQANDLVVHTDSMTSIAGVTLPPERTLALPQNGRTMHTMCFRDPDIIAQLRAWLIDGDSTTAQSALLHDTGKRPSRRLILRARRQSASRRQAHLPATRI